MRFIDWNGTGGIDAQDIARSVVLDEARPDDDDDYSVTKSGQSNNSISANASQSGCMTLIICCFVTAITIGALVGLP